MKLEKGLKFEGGWKTFSCGFCSYSWIPRVDVPKSCPYCHRYFIKPAKVLPKAKKFSKSHETKGEAR